MDPSTREGIVSHALKIFADVGYKEATVRQICRAAKANVCLVSYYFDGKDGLYLAVVESILNEKIQFAQNQFSGSGSYEGRDEYRLRLQIFLENFFHEHRSRPEVFRILYRELMNDGHPKATQMVESFMLAVRKKFVEFIELGQKKKFVKKNLDPALTAAAGINMIMGFVAQLSLPGKAKLFFPNGSEKEMTEKILKNTLPIFLDGVINNEINH